MLDHINQRLDDPPSLEVSAVDVCQLKASRREVIDRYYKQICDLWKLLDTPAEEVDAFSAKCQINLSTETIQLVGVCVAIDGSTRAICGSCRRR